MDTHTYTYTQYLGFHNHQPEITSLVHVAQVAANQSKGSSGNLKRVPSVSDQVTHTQRE